MLDRQRLRSGTCTLTIGYAGGTWSPVRQLYPPCEQRALCHLTSYTARKNERTNKTHKYRATLHLPPAAWPSETEIRLATSSPAPRASKPHHCSPAFRILVHCLKHNNPMRSKRRSHYGAFARIHRATFYNVRSCEQTTYRIARQSHFGK